MKLSTRLIRNAATTYARLGTTFVLGIFFTWFVIGKIGMLLEDLAEESRA